MATDAELPFDRDEPYVQDSRAGAIRRKRNTFRTYPAPDKPMSKTPRAWVIKSDLSQVPPPELTDLAEWFESQPDARERFRWALRDSLDEVLDGQRTGHWAYQQLTKTERTYLGTAVEVNLTKEFEIENGEDLDWQVNGVDLDCKFSKDLGGWEIPMEMYVCAAHEERSGKADHPALLVWLNDDASHWAAGLLTITDDRLRWKQADAADPRLRQRAYNRDNKRKLADESVADVYWLWGGLQTDLPSNLLLGLPEEARSRILKPGSSGQGRVNQLFREVQQRIVGRQTVLTVAQQDDAPKRARDARKQLRAEGIVVLGHQDSHPHVARALGLPVPVKGEWIAVRLRAVPATHSGGSFELSGQRWAIAEDASPTEPAPAIPTSIAPFTFFPVAN